VEQKAMSSNTVESPGRPHATARSVGMKFLAICGLSALMMIPVLFVKEMVVERALRAEIVSQEIGDLLGGRQALLGPSLLVPYTVPATKIDGTVSPATNGTILVSPERGEITGKVTVEERRRSLFKVPVYKTDLLVKAKFNLPDIQAQAPQGAVVDWKGAKIIVAASSAKGALEDIVFQVNGQPLAADPVALDTLEVEPPNLSMKLAVDDIGTKTPNTQYGFGVVPTTPLQPGMSLDVSTRLKFSGVKELALLAFAKSTTMSMSSNWLNPRFSGGFLPQSREIKADGFSANWAIPYIARGVAAADGFKTLSSQLNKNAPIVQFAPAITAYQPIDRSLKYALLFIGIVFLTYFLFEVTSVRRVHVAQYILVGLSQVVFYLLLLSFSERIGFDLAFLVSASATVGLIGLYAGSVFASRKQGLIALLVFGILYGLIYVLMSLEDYALMVGSIAAFAVIAAVMYFTKGIDWYGLAQIKPDPKTPLSKTQLKETT
jgi:inner membrane protein